MKKILLLLTALLVLTMILTSCEVFVPDVTYECKHVDEDGNHICEICGYDWNPKAIWCYDKNGHWMIYDSTNGPVPDVVWLEGEHTYENDGVKCDKCPYCRHIDDDANNSCDVCGDDFPG